MESSYPERKILRRMKYLSDQKGILNRFLAEAGHWDQHLEKTRKFILGCLGEKSYRSVAVLGSGWLLDVPLDQMSEQCGEVLLYDVVHPPQILKKLSRYGNVSAIPADITGGAIRGAWDLAGQYRKTGRGSILDIACQAVLPGSGPDYVISLNILNQLDILLVDYLKMHIDIPVEDELEFRKRIQSQHLSLLEPGLSCLVTDVEERVMDKNDRQVSSKILVYCDLQEGRKAESWTWDFDTRGAYNPRHRTEMRVRAIEF